MKQIIEALIDAGFEPDEAYRVAEMIEEDE